MSEAEELIRKIEGKLTSAEYVAERGQQCPYCKTRGELEFLEEDDHGHAIPDKEVAFRECAFYATKLTKCLACGTHYRDLWRIVGYEEVKNG